MSMKQKVTNLRYKLAKMQQAPMLAKAAHAEAVAVQSVDLLDEMADMVQLIGESYNGLLAYINQISDDPMAVEELNAKLKAGGFGLYSNGNSSDMVVSDGE